MQRAQSREGELVAARAHKTTKVCVLYLYSGAAYGAMYNGNKAAPASHNVFNWVSNYATNAIIASIGLRVRGRRPNVCNANTARGASITGPAAR
jgi:hypothetical protein